MTFDNPQFTKLELVTRPTVTTEEAAHYLNRKPQTLRSWASAEPTGAIRPLRIMGRLAWPVAAIRALLEGGANENPDRRKTVGV